MDRSCIPPLSGMTTALLLVLLLLPLVAKAQENDKFLLDGTAQVAQDPQNSQNDVIKIDTTLAPGTCVAPSYQNCAFGTVSRRLGVKIQDLTDELEAKWFFSSRSCGGGSPRIELSVDLNGDGKPDGNLFGYFGPAGGVGGCVMGKWMYEDLTDGLARWDVSQLVNPCMPPTPCPPRLPPPQNAGASGYFPWQAVVAAIEMAYPQHNICTGDLADDSGWDPAAEGVAYYDIIGIGFDSLENRTDVGGRGFASGCKPNDQDDGEVKDDGGDDAKFNDSASQPQTSSLMYDDPSQGMYLQSVGAVRSITYSGPCVSFAGDALVNGNPGYLFTFEACELSTLGTAIGNFTTTVTGPAGYLYQKIAVPMTSGYVNIHPH